MTTILPGAEFRLIRTSGQIRLIRHFRKARNFRALLLFSSYSRTIRPPYLFPHYEKCLITCSLLFVSILVHARRIGFLLIPSDPSSDIAHRLIGLSWFLHLKQCTGSSFPLAFLLTCRSSTNTHTHTATFSTSLALSMPITNQFLLSS